MKSIVEFIHEGIDSHHLSPKKPDELVNIIISLLKKGQTDLNCIDVSKITDMSNLFYKVSDNLHLEDIDISKWDVSNVTNMRGMFDGCRYFNADLSKWNVSNVTNMQNMFRDCKYFNSDLSKWNTHNVKIMTDMFDGCKKLHKLPSWYKDDSYDDDPASWEEQ